MDFPQDLIHGAPIGKPVASRAKVTAVYGEEDGTEVHFSRMYTALPYMGVECMGCKEYSVHVVLGCSVMWC